MPNIKVVDDFSFTDDLHLQLAKCVNFISNMRLAGGGIAVSKFIRDNPEFKEKLEKLLQDEYESLKLQLGIVEKSREV